MVLKEKIIRYSKQIGIDLIGFTNSDCTALEERLMLSKKLNLTSKFVSHDIKQRINPKLLMDNTKTIIVIGLAYPKDCQYLDHLKSNEVYFGNSSWGLDYHVVLRNKLLKLINYIKTIVSDLEYKIAIDTSPLDDRYLAYKAGLGFYGKHSLLINQKYGSYIFLGSMLTNLDIPIDKPLTITCKNCDKCREACPTKAINDSGLLDSNKCLSYITQKKEDLTADEIKLMNNCIYGCDICQRVCPYNEQVEYHHHLEFEPTGIEFINVDKYQSLSNKEFKQIYGHLAGAWRGSKVIERNIKIYKEKISLNKHL